MIGDLATALLGAYCAWKIIHVWILKERIRNLESRRDTE